MSRVPSTTRLILFCICAALLCPRCSFSPLDGGGTIETTNGRVTGTIVHQSGAAAPDARVMLIQTEYDPIKDPPVPVSRIAITDKNGQFSFSSVPQGAYNIQAAQNTRRNRLLITGITVGTGMTVVATDTLKPPGEIKVILPVPDTLNAANGYFYIEGTTIAMLLSNHDGVVVIHSVPAGSTPAIRYAVKGCPWALRKIKDSVTVTPDATTTIVYFDWNYSRRLFLNTSTSGADAAGDVTGFPVLVRLNRNNFEFTEAKSGGEDLRFTGSGGSPLPFEIERWDAAEGRAEVWVKVDTIFGNNDTQSITMHWGNASTAAAANGKAVFDTAAAGGGFQGVWHLGQPGNTTVEDATANGYDGRPYKMTVSSAVAGMIGTAQEFTGDSAHIEMNNTADGALNFPENSRYTISAWVYADTIDFKNHVIATKGHMRYFLKLKMSTWEFVEWKNNQGCQSSEDKGNAMARQWFHLAGVRNGASQYIFVNGRLADSVIMQYSSAYPTDHSRNFSIGGYLQFMDYGADKEGFAGFKGILDEVRASNVPRSADWIKLCYMNQKESDALVVFQTPKSKHTHEQAH